jgi:hypothetical protein
MLTPETYKTRRGVKAFPLFRFAHLERGSWSMKSCKNTIIVCQTRYFGLDPRLRLMLSRSFGA